MMLTLAAAIAAPLVSNDRSANAAPGALRARKKAPRRELQPQMRQPSNVLAIDGTDLSQTCIYLHDLTPCP